MFKQIASVAAFATVAMAWPGNFAQPIVDAEEIGLGPMARVAFEHYGMDLQPDSYYWFTIQSAGGYQWYLAESENAVYELIDQKKIASDSGLIGAPAT